MTTYRYSPLPDTDELRAMVGIDSRGQHHATSDRYGVAYIGPAAHLVLAAVLRRDMTPQLGTRYPEQELRIRSAARYLGNWFTSDDAPAGDRAVFRAMTARQVCGLVLHLAALADFRVLAHVGPTTIGHYTSYLTNPQLALEEATQFPHHDQDPTPLRYADDDLTLDLTAVGPHGADTVPVPVAVHATRGFSWAFQTPISLPVTELNHLLSDPDYLPLQDYLDTHFEQLIRPHLHSEHNIHPTGVCLTAHLHTHNLDDPGPPALPSLPLYFVGPDPATAVATTPFLHHDDAVTTAHACGHHVFVSPITVAPEHLQLLAPPATAPAARSGDHAINAPPGVVPAFRPDTSAAPAHLGGP